MIKLNSVLSPSTTPPPPTHTDSTLKSLINAELVFEKADRGQNLIAFSDTDFCRYLILTNFATQIFSNGRKKSSFILVHKLKKKVGQTYSCEITVNDKRVFIICKSLNF